MFKRGFNRTLAVTMLLFSGMLAAHDLPTNTVMNAFIKLEPHQAHLVVRVPLDLLRGVPFPSSGGRYEMSELGPAVQETLRALSEGLPLWENGTRLAPSSSTGRLTLPSDRSFEDYEHALSVAGEPTDLTTAIYFDQGFFDAHFTYAIASPKSVFKIQTLVASDLGMLARLSIRYMPLGERSRVMLIFSGSEPVALNPAWYHAASGFVVLGFEHILSGIDHLLFLFCLIIPFRRLRGLIPVITAFTLAHSVTLIGSAYHLAPTGGWFPPFVETAIAASIVYMSLENIVGADLRRRWLITGLFGLVHGFGFSYALAQNLQFAGSHLLLSLFSFNIGIEIGQLAVLALMLPLLALVRRWVPERMGVIILSAIVAHTAWHWMIDRWDVLWQTPWPRFDAAALTVLARWVAGLLLAVAAARVFARFMERRFPKAMDLPSAPQPAQEKHLELVS